MWKALSLLKLERLSVAGSNGTEWMKVETDGDSWNRMKLLKLNQLHINNVNQLQAAKILRTKALACCFLINVSGVFIC